MYIKIITLILFAQFVIGSSVSFNFLTKNDGKYLYDTFSFIKKNITINHEIIVIDDYSDNLESLDYLDKAVKDFGIILKKNHLNKDFSQQRNFSISLSSKDYIFVIDSDERPAKILLESLGKILSTNKDAYSLPFAHYISNIPKDHPWLDSKGRVCWPSMHIRIFKNNGIIKFKNRIHEVVVNHESLISLPADEDFALIEEKSWEKWNNSYLFYLTCFDDELFYSFEENNFKKAFEILSNCPTEHPGFLFSGRYRKILKKLGFNWQETVKMVIDLMDNKPWGSSKEADEKILNWFKAAKIEL